MLQVDPDVTARLGRRLRKVTSQLGKVRELDVLLLLAEELHESDRYDPAAVDRVVDRISRERSRARRRIGKRLPVDELKRIARKLDRVLEAVERADAADRSADAARAWRWATQARVARRASALLGAVRLAGALYLPDRLHTVRIGVKKLRYAFELSCEIAGTKGSADLLTLKRAQDLLGRMHDIQLLVDRVRQVQASVAAPELSTWRNLDVLTTTLENGCRRLHGRYVHERAALEELCERLGPRAAAHRPAGERRQAG